MSNTTTVNTTTVNTTTFNATITANDALLDHCIANESDRNIGLTYDVSCFIGAAGNPIFTLGCLMSDPATGDGIDHTAMAAQLAIPEHVMHARVVAGVPLADYERYVGRMAMAWLQNHRAVLLMQYLEENPHLIAHVLGLANASAKNEPPIPVMGIALAKAA